MVKKLIRGIMKTLITIISIGALLTSFIGGISIFQVISTPDSIDIDPDSADMNLGVLGNSFSIDMSFNNERGYYTFDNFTISVSIELRAKESNVNISYMDQILYQEDLAAGQDYTIALIAEEDDFSTENFLLQNNNSWYDPEVALYLNNATINETAEIQTLSYPYLLWHYDVALSIQIVSSYNLGLVDFGLSIEYIADYYQYFTQDYPTMKENIMTSYGI
ncbi:hypothetical protein NEF87_000057 [Candidatus Lokiarchaeum ossiferum]|uniref:SbsA Ig-like domain-containing protein n=1 Tax=Candidatus Lokiarchaeum ossiferum TaxID=2951803 RepID=A0ABY6HJR4_9ARCH|nr:hypothetical protein NEF87_000057 [Candidatus Lokiarchaeum sp. B-35]